MIVETECSHCNGVGEVATSTPNTRSRMVSFDDLNPNDFSEPCPVCLGTGLVENDPEDEVEAWMK